MAVLCLLVCSASSFHIKFRSKNNAADRFGSLPTRFQSYVGGVHCLCMLARVYVCVCLSMSLPIVSTHTPAKLRIDSVDYRATRDESNNKRTAGLPIINCEHVGIVSICACVYVCVCVCGTRRMKMFWRVYEFTYITCSTTIVCFTMTKNHPVIYITQQGDFQ